MCALLAAAGAAAAQDAGPPPAAPFALDNFSGRIGFPTFPAARPSLKAVPAVPFIFNGPSYKANYIGEITKLPLLNEARANAARTMQVAPPPPPTAP